MTKFRNTIVGKIMRLDFTGAAKSIWTGLVDGLLGKGAFSSLTNQISKNDLTGADQAQNSFNASEAEKERAWSEHMRDTSIQSSIDQYRAAGINPAAVYGQVTASTPTGASASGENDISGGLSSLASFMNLASQMRLNKSLGVKAKADAKEAESRADLNKSLAGQADANKAYLEQASKFKAAMDEAAAARDNKMLELYDSQIQHNYELVNSEKGRQALIASEVNLNDYKSAQMAIDTALKKVDLKYREAYIQAQLEFTSSMTELNIVKASLTEEQTEAESKRIEMLEVDCRHYGQKVMLEISRLNHLTNSALYQSISDKWMSDTGTKRQVNSKAIAGYLTAGSMVINSVVSAANPVAGAVGSMSESISQMLTPKYVENYLP